MEEYTGTPYTAPARWDVPSGAEVAARQAFQMLHPEVGFAPVARPEPPRWLAYWLGGDCKPRHLEAATLGGLVGLLEDEFGTSGPTGNEPGQT